MSQTETFLLILVGFSIGALIFLFAARALWRAGVRLGARRSRRQVPSNVAELRSERDSLRGDYARLSQKLNARIEQARLDMAEQMAEVARHRNRLVQMTGDLNDRDAEIERQRQKLAAQNEELSDKTARLSELEGELRSANDALSGHQAELQKLRLHIADLEALNTINMPSSRETLADDEQAAADRLQRRIEQLSGLSQTIAAERNLLQSSDPSVIDPLLQEKLASAIKETADLQQELARLDTAWAAKLGEPAGSTEMGKPPRAVANVVNLAQRIRALQKDLGR